MLKKFIGLRCDPKLDIWGSVLPFYQKTRSLADVLAQGQAILRPQMKEKIAFSLINIRDKSNIHATRNYIKFLYTDIQTVTCFVAKQGIMISNWIYWTLTNDNYKALANLCSSVYCRTH
jgi:hypothetical protein